MLQRGVSVPYTQNREQGNMRRRPPHRAVCSGWRTINYKGSTESSPVNAQAKVSKCTCYLLVYTYMKEGANYSCESWSHCSLYIRWFFRPHPRNVHNVCCACMWTFMCIFVCIWENKSVRGVTSAVVVDCRFAISSRCLWVYAHLCNNDDHYDCCYRYGLSGRTRFDLSTRKKIINRRR